MKIDKKLGWEPIKNTIYILEKPYDDTWLTLEKH